jgi:hypothetical protein
MSASKTKSLRRKLRSTTEPTLTISEANKLADENGVSLRQVRRDILGPNPRIGETPADVREKLAAQRVRPSRMTKGPADYAKK